MLFRSSLSVSLSFSLPLSLSLISLFLSLSAQLHPTDPLPPQSTGQQPPPPRPCYYMLCKQLKMLKLQKHPLNLSVIPALGFEGSKVQHQQTIENAPANFFRPSANPALGFSAGTRCGGAAEGRGPAGTPFGCRLRFPTERGAMCRRISPEEPHEDQTYECSMATGQAGHERHPIMTLPVSIPWVLEKPSLLACLQEANGSLSIFVFLRNSPEQP